MKVKIDTKEKFNVLTIQEPVLSANMTAQINEELLSFLEKENKNVVIKMEEVKEIDEPVADCLITLQQKFYENNASLVICGITPSVKQYLDDKELLDMLNITPTESEAWDIVQMEEIERELNLNS